MNTLFADCGADANRRSVTALTRAATGDAPNSTRRVIQPTVCPTPVQHGDRAGGHAEPPVPTRRIGRARMLSAAAVPRERQAVRGSYLAESRLICRLTRLMST